MEWTALPAAAPINLGSPHPTRDTIPPRLTLDQGTALLFMLLAAACFLSARQRYSSSSHTLLLQKKLADTWAKACEMMLSKSALGENLHLTPADQLQSNAKQTVPLPQKLHTHVLYALTAFDPPGISRSLEENTAANGKLWRNIKSMRPQPDAVWPSWG